MIVGVTGTRDGMTKPQLAAVRRHAEACAPIAPVVLHTGGCVGADRQFHDVFRDVFADLRIVTHPASGLPEELCDWSDADELLDAMPPLRRNADIVDAIVHGTLWAAPKGPEERRSGTWACVRYARKARRGIVYFWPDGTVTSEVKK